MACPSPDYCSLNGCSNNGCRGGVVNWQPTTRQRKRRVDWLFIGFWTVAIVFCVAFWLAIAEAVRYFFG